MQLVLKRYVCWIFIFWGNLLTKWLATKLDCDVLLSAIASRQWFMSCFVSKPEAWGLRSSVANAGQIFCFCFVIAKGHCRPWYLDMLRPLIISFTIIPLPLLEPLLCLDTVFDVFCHISNPVKALLAINLVVCSAPPGVVFVVSSYGALGIDIYRLAILQNRVSEAITENHKYPLHTSLRFLRDHLVSWVSPENDENYVVYSTTDND